MIHVETSFLVDLMREAARGESGPATRFLESRPEEVLGASVFVFCELAAGAELARDTTRERERVARLMESLETVNPDEAFATTYGRFLARMQRAGCRSGQWTSSSAPRRSRAACRSSRGTGRTSRRFPASTC